MADAVALAMSWANETKDATVVPPTVFGNSKYRNAFSRRANRKKYARRPSLPIVWR